ncbi:MAG: zf-HC2 domain-containing protein [Acidobacteriota bacterium]
MHDKTACREMFERLSPYIDGELNPEMCEALEGHMADCEPCRRYLASLETTRDALREMGKKDPLSEEDKRELFHSCMEALKSKLNIR